MSRRSIEEAPTIVCDALEDFVKGLLASVRRGCRVCNLALTCPPTAASVLPLFRIFCNIYIYDGRQTKSGEWETLVADRDAARKEAARLEAQVSCLLLLLIDWFYPSSSLVDM